MKPRQTTYQTGIEISQINHKQQKSSKNRHRGVIPTGPGSFKLNFSDRTNSPNSQVPESELCEPQAKSEHSDLLAGELSSLEIQAFSLACLKYSNSISNKDTNSDIENTLKQLATLHLPSYTALLSELSEASKELKQLVSWSKQFVAKSKPQLENPKTPLTKANKVSIAVLESVERCMGAKFRVKNLKQRIDLIRQEIPSFVQANGEELGLPSPIAQKIAIFIQKALHNLY